MGKDYSEFQYTKYDEYRALRENTKELRFDFFHNYAFFSEEQKTISIHVDHRYEIDAIAIYLMNYDKELSKRNGKDYEDYKERLKYSRIMAEMLQAENPEIMRSLSARYGDKIYFADRHQPPPTSDVDSYIKKYWPPVNLLGAATLTLNYGEGLLDFLYADFKTPIEDLKQVIKTLPRPEANETDDEDDTEKIRTHTEEHALEYFDYVFSFFWFHKILYKSLYTASCPPIIESALTQPEPLLRYASYLLALQEEYAKIMQFCYDENYYPNVLGRLMPHERYTLYRRLNQMPNTTERKEILRLSYYIPGHKRGMPYSMTREEYAARLSKSQPLLSGEEKKFLKEFHISKEQLYESLLSPAFMSIDYAFSTVEQILELEFTKMLEQNVRFRKCKRCGKYFIMKGNYDTNYCDRVAEGETRTCQQIASQENYKARHADNKAIQIYNKYYKRYAARVKVNQIKEQDFNTWRYQAIRKRDECSDGKITPEEFTEWMEASFSNRKPRKPKEESE